MCNNSILQLFDLLQKIKYGVQFVNKILLSEIEFIICIYELKEAILSCKR